jgi:hypothetical protein
VAVGGARRLCDHFDDRVGTGSAQHLGCILRIDQDDVGACGFAQLADAALQDRQVRLHRGAAQHRIGAKLPQNDVGLLGNDVALEARALVVIIVAVDAAVHDREVEAGKPVGKLEPEPVRVGPVRRARAFAIGRRRADGDDLDRLPFRHQSRRARQRAIEVRQFRRNDAGRRNRRRVGPYWQGAVLGPSWL